MGETLDFRNLFLQEEIKNDAGAWRVLTEIGQAFANDAFTAEKTPREWLQWLIKNIRQDWVDARSKGGDKEEFIADYVTEMAEKFSRAKGRVPVTRDSLELAVRTIVYQVPKTK